jgi:hypothetical protein
MSSSLTLSPYLLTNIVELLPPTLLLSPCLFEERRDYLLMEYAAVLEIGEAVGFLLY